MPTSSTRPIIFISYSHKDEPEHPRDDEVRWLSFVRTYLGPAVKNGIFELWDDHQLPGGSDWDPIVGQKLQDCDIFILLVSANSMASDQVIDKEIAIIRDRQSNKEDVHFYPILLTPTPDAGLDKINDKNLRPRNAKPLSGFSYDHRMDQMKEIANEIGRIARHITTWKSLEWRETSRVQPASVHISGLPETPYERLVGREAELKRLDEAWSNDKINIVSLIAEGGAGKSALVNEWLRRMQVENYRGAEAVLGWSFYSQGTKERATSAEEFLTWVLDKLGLKIQTTSAITKGEAIADELTRRRVLLVLDGVEPLQHGPGDRLDELKDLGLRALLRRFAAAPPLRKHGLVVLTSRLVVKDIRHWRGGAASVVAVERLSDDAGAALLRDNGVWGTDNDLKIAVQQFEGHPLALNLLASFLTETQTGDVRRRDNIRSLLTDHQNPGHDHASRVMESYENEWLAQHPLLLAIMQMVGLFDRPASGECLQSLLTEPVIDGLTDQISRLDDGERHIFVASVRDERWQHAVARLREVRLLAPADLNALHALDAHPLVREWFGERLRQKNETAWKAAHARLYEHLRDTTEEGDAPTLEDLAPLYQAITHGCRAGRHQETLDDVYARRIYWRKADGRLQLYSTAKLGAFGSDLAALFWFFERPYVSPIATLTPADRSWVLGVVAHCLRAQGRLAEALPAERAALRMSEDEQDWKNAAAYASNLSEVALLAGEVTEAATTAQRSVTYASRSGDDGEMVISRTAHADALHAAGHRREAALVFADAEQRQKQHQPARPLLYSVQGYGYCDLLLSQGDYATAGDRAKKILDEAEASGRPLDISLVRLALARAHLGLALPLAEQAARRGHIRSAVISLDRAVEGLRSANTVHHIPRGLLARAAFRRSVGNWDGAARDLDEVEEIAEPGPMRLFLCDTALERTRLACARIEAFAPLNGVLEMDNPRKPSLPTMDKVGELKAEAEKELKIAADYINKCGYRRREEELAELQAVLRGERTFASLPPRV